MAAISRWLETLGISPLLAGVVLGAFLFFLLSRLGGREAKHTLGAAVGMRQARDAVADARLFSGMKHGFQHTQIRIENNGQPFELAGAAGAELLEMIRTGRKIEAIKLVREHSGLDLKDAKHLVEALEAGVAARE